jgi:hypothetical protein
MHKLDRLRFALGAAKHLILGAEVQPGRSRYVVLVFARDLTIEKITAGELAGALKVLPRQVRQVRQRPSEAATRSGRVRLSVFVCTHDLESIYLDARRLAMQ